jgi:hypothetical protein
MTPQAEMVLWLFNGLLAGMLLTLSVGYILSRPERWPPSWYCWRWGLSW